MLQSAKIKVFRGITEDLERKNRTQESQMLKELQFYFKELTLHNTPNSDN